MYERHTRKKRITVTLYTEKWTHPSCMRDTECRPRQKGEQGRQEWTPRAMLVLYFMRPDIYGHTGLSRALKCNHLPTKTMNASPTWLLNPSFFSIPTVLYAMVFVIHNRLWCCSSCRLFHLPRNQFTGDVKRHRKGHTSANKIVRVICSAWFRYLTHVLSQVFEVP